MDPAPIPPSRWLDAIEKALVETAHSATSPRNLTPAQAVSGLAGVAAKFLAVGTPRSIGLIGCGALIAPLLQAQAAYAAPQQVRFHEPRGASPDAMMAAHAAAQAAGIRESHWTELERACGCDIVVVAAPVTIRRNWVRAGTLITILHPDAAIDPALLAAADVYTVDEHRPGAGQAHTLAAVAAGFIDGRQSDEITVLLPRGAPSTRWIPVAELGPPTCDVVLLVATLTEENELIDAARALGIEPRRQRTLRLGDFYDLGKVGDDRVLAVRTAMGPIKHRGSAHAALLFQLETQATALVQLGTAFGVRPEAQALGDVLVARSVVPYDERDVKEIEGEVVVDYQRLKRRRAKGELVRAFEREVQRAGASVGFGVHLGALLSGASRIWSAQFRDQLVRELSADADPIVGGDMEGIGLVAASPADRPLWCIVKGISDFADAERDAIIEKTRGPAARNAARFVLSALAHRGT